MIELTFDPSFAATLRNRGDHDVIVLPPDLQFGDLRRLSGTPSDFYAFKAAHFDLGRPQSITADALAQTDVQSLASFQQAVAAGAALRLWWTDVPDDMVGRYWLASQLAETPITLTQVHIRTAMPRHTTGANGELYVISGLGGVDPDWLPELAATATPLTPADLRGYRYGWASLIEANSALRVVVNGQLLSVAETFHDWALREHMSTAPKTFPQRVHLIGTLMGDYPVGVPDWWWDARIDALSANKKNQR